MKKLAQLRDEQAALKRIGIGILDLAEAEGRDFTAEEARDLERLKENTARIDAEITKEEERQNLRRELTEVKDPNRLTEKEERALQGKADKAIWESKGDFLRAVAYAAENPHHADPRLVWQSATPTGSGERTPSDGGYLVGSDIMNELLAETYSLAKIAPLCRQTNIGPGSKGLTINMLDERSRANGSRFGGILAYWRGEADTFTASSPKFRQVNIDLEKLTALWYVTEELMQDAISLDSMVMEIVPEELAFRLDDGILNGTGVGMPLGVLHPANTALVTVAKESSQTGASIIAANVQKMYARMWPSSQGRAVWVMNTDCWPQIFALKQDTITVPMMLERMSDSPTGMTILGRPVYVVEQAETMGTLNDISFIDFDQVRLIRKGGIQKDSSMHVRFLQQEMVFRFVMRVNSRPTRHTPLTPFKGSATISPYINLAVRP